MRTSRTALRVIRPNSWQKSPVSLMNRNRQVEDIVIVLDTIVVVVVDLNVDLVVVDFTNAVDVTFVVVVFY